MSCTSTVKPAFCTWSIQAPQHPQVGVLWTVMRGRAAGVASADWTTTCAAGEVVGCADEASWVQAPRPATARTTKLRRYNLNVVISNSSLSPCSPTKSDYRHGGKAMS